MRRSLSLAALMGIAAAPVQTPAPPPPRLDLTLSPHSATLGVRMVLDAPGFKAGEPVVRLPLSLVGIPTARYDGDALRAQDDSGPLPLVQDEEKPTPQGVYRRWKAARDSVGPVTISFSAPPRAVTAATNNGPLFDLRAEGGGFVGAGVGFMATPARPGPYRIRLHWDLKDAPAGSLGTWSLGTGDVETVAPADLLSFSFYAVGPIKSAPAAPDPNFGLYWLNEPPFPAEQLGERIRRLYAAMAAFFGEKVGSYRVFIRQNPYAGTGGTALAHSFMFGYNPAARPTIDSLQSLLSHEMAHNWPAMEGEHGDTAWYSEGTAEYYSMLLSHRAGLLPVDRLLESLNKKAYDYYTNPFRALTNPEAARRFWSDPTAQTVPYGRGFLYLARTDDAIRTRSGGKRSLDDIVRELRRRQVKGEAYGIAQWLDLVGQQLGPQVAKRDYDAMVSGALLAAPAHRFAPCLRTERHDERLFELGFARASLGDRVVRGLDPASEAARAGVREGDAIVEVGDLSKIRSDPALPMTLTLRREGQLVRLSYPPRGAQVEAYRWRRSSNAPAASCRF